MLMKTSASETSFNKVSYLVLGITNFILFFAFVFVYIYL